MRNLDRFDWDYIKWELDRRDRYVGWVTRFVAYESDLVIVGGIRYRHTKFARMEVRDKQSYPML